MPSATTQTDTNWSVEYDTRRRNKLFKKPPRDRSAFPLLQATVKPHVESFNALFGDTGLIKEALEDIGTHTVADGDTRDTSRATPKNRLQLRVTNVVLEPPRLPAANKYTTNKEIYPAECRERAATYRGAMTASFEYKVNSGEWLKANRNFGQLPIMVRSNRCHIEKFTPRQMVAHKEDSRGAWRILHHQRK